MGWFSKDICGSCGNEVKSGVKGRKCNHWICCNCIIQKSARTTHWLGKDTMLCPTCGKDSGWLHDDIIKRCQGK